jgi:hypothetical protein
MTILFVVTVWAGLAPATVGATLVTNNGGLRNDR